MSLLTRCFLRLGFTRDMVLWLVLKLVGVASLIVSGVFDLPYWAGYLGLRLSPTVDHWIIAASVGILWLGGQYSTSALPSKAELETVSLPKEKSA